jgi:hypothetical protein
MFLVCDDAMCQLCKRLSNAATTLSTKTPFSALQATSEQRPNCDDRGAIDMVCFPLHGYVKLTRTGRALQFSSTPIEIDM